MPMEPLHSASWHRVAELRPRLGPQVHFHLHRYRGEPWYVVRSPVTGRVHRLTPAAHALASLMDGERTTHEIWDAVAQHLGDDAPTQDETIRVLGVLHGADLLRCDASPDTAALLRRAREQDEREQRQARNPIAFRVPLCDPDAFLERWQHWVRPVFSRGGAALWAALVAAAAVSALRHGPELAASARTLLEPASVVAVWFAYPLVKALHELGHAFAVKRWGGEVHEIGILFLVFVPVPYVDASASAVFPEKQRRMVVSGAGIAVELALASIAFFVWISAEPSALRHLAQAVMLVGGVSSLFFNGNPLLRFDGYYVLADAIEIPNLGAKANQYLGALTRRWVLGLRHAPLPDLAPGERPWLVGYAVASFVYRIGVLLAIALYLAGHFFVIGVALAILTLFARIVLPLLRQVGFVIADPALGERRGRAVAGGVASVALLAVVLLVVPIPLRTASEGVIWLPEHSHVRAGADGFVVELLAEPDTYVEAGDPLVRTRDPLVEARLRALEAERREAQLRVQALTQTDRMQADIAREELAQTEAELARARERAGAVLIRSAASGRFVPAGGIDWTGRYVRQGETVGFVVDLSTATVRVVVGQADVALLRERTEAVWVRLAHDLGTVLPARIARQVPAATDRLPTAALGTAGGGRFAADPADPEGLRALESVFQFELALPEGLSLPAAGQRLHVRFDHGSEPIAARAHRMFRRIFLRQLGV